MTTRITSDNITDGTIATADLGAGVGGVNWQAVKTGNFTAVAGEGYFVDTTSGGVTMTLPGSASVGDEIIVHDYAGQFDNNEFSIDRNGHKLNGATTDGSVNGENNTVRLVYVDTTQGWRTVLNVTPSSVGPTYTSATGGTETTSGDFKIHTFNSSSNFVVASLGNSGGSGSTASYLVVAGGGGAGTNHGAGAGAGGFREGKDAPKDTYTASPLNAPAGITLSAQSYPITVGGGGNGAAASTSGSNSVFSTITSAGGGRGGSNNDAPYHPGGDGGSGGGSKSTGTIGSGNTPPVSPAQGNDGGQGHPSDNGTGGGGGATAAGTPGASQPGGGPGGAGAPTNISGSNVSYAGGGGGNAQSGPEGTGGSGGGGNADQSSGGAGTANTGGGGAGSQGNGGSGVVIIRYKYQN
jgi:hypothetical protein